MKSDFAPPVARGCYYPRPSECSHAAEAHVENGQLYPGYYQIDPANKSRVVADLPLPVVKFIHRFATRCSLDCCGWAALAFDEPSANDARWTIELRVEDECARVRGAIEGSSAELLWFPQMRLDATRNTVFVSRGNTDLSCLKRQRCHNIVASTTF